MEWARPPREYHPVSTADELKNLKQAFADTKRWFREMAEQVEEEQKAFHDAILFYLTILDDQDLMRHRETHRKAVGDFRRGDSQGLRGLSPQTEIGRSVFSKTACSTSTTSRTVSWRKLAGGGECGNGCPRNADAFHPLRQGVDDQPRSPASRSKACWPSSPMPAVTIPMRRSS
ncbi:MAG: hypothetical protein MZU97_01360 [Bacillus subtilis]|nr:hypothetical protein [Bacillus subtilis]